MQQKEKIEEQFKAVFKALDDADKTEGLLLMYTFTALEKFKELQHLVREDLDKYQTDWNFLIEQETSHQNLMKLVPERYKRFTYFFGRMLMAPKLWPKFWTLKSFLENTIEKYRTDFNNNASLAKKMEESREYYEGLQKEPGYSENLKLQAGECVKITEEIATMSSRLAATCERIVKYQQRQLERFYRKKSEGA